MRLNSIDLNLVGWLVGDVVAAGLGSYVGYGATLSATQLCLARRNGTNHATRCVSGGATVPELPCHSSCISIGYERASPLSQVSAECSVIGKPYHRSTPQSPTSLRLQTSLRSHQRKR